MRRVRVVHWKAEEADALISAVRKSGFEPEFDADPSGAIVAKAISARPPRVALIDLSRLPGKGRELAVWMRNRKSTRGIPIVFFGGEPGKVEKVRAVLPDAIYTDLAGLGHSLKAACQARAADPVIPPSAMERFRGKSAAQKLGITAGSGVAVMNAPRDYAAVVGGTPEGAEFFEDSAQARDVTLWFIRDSEAMLNALHRMRALAAKTKLWVIWPKEKANRFREVSIREMAAENGLVDYKVCSLNEAWSGILFARKKT